MKSEQDQPKYTRFNSYGFLKLYRDGVQIASTALPGAEGTKYLDDIQCRDQVELWEKSVKNNPPKRVL